MALDTVQDYIDKSRALLQDAVIPYRYSDADMMDALNQGIMESRRIRPDITLASFRLTLPEYLTVGSTVAIDPQYRMAFVYYICGQMQLSDQEDVQDTRAIAFLNKFTGQLTSGG